MKREISLYIGDMEVDLSGDSFILFNWSMEDLTNPTIVKNSYSQDLTLPGTPQNNKIFGQFFRVDRTVNYYTDKYTEYGFDPSRKTPFTIYNELNEIEITGYVKLNNVIRSGSTVQYSVTLYGGLGSFFYSLSYDESGNKKTLASLDWLGTDNPASELDFKINAETVRAAWDYERTGDTFTIWDVINFAPAYNGIPDGDFSADKAIVKPENVGLPKTQSADDKSYTVKNGYALVNLSEEHDEWAMKDLRSYLQRPVFSVGAFFRAISKPENNGGFTVDLSSLENPYGNPFYNNMWVTLPLLTELSKGENAPDVTIEQTDPSVTAGMEVGNYAVSPYLPSNAKVSATVNFSLRYYVQGAADVQVLKTQMVNDSIAGMEQIYSSVIFVQLLAYSGVVCTGGGKVACISSVKDSIGRQYTAEYLANVCNYHPAFAESESDLYENTPYSSQFDNSRIPFTQNDEMTLSAEGYGVTNFVLHVTSYLVYQFNGSAPAPLTSGNTSLAMLYETDGTEHQSSGITVAKGSKTDVISAEVSGETRSGAQITKSVILSTDTTPADYLLSFCKLFGLHFLFDDKSKTISIVTRNTLYSTYKDKILDLSGRINFSQGITIDPFVFTTQWYDFILESDGGKFYENYKTLYGIDYGMQRVNTGYEFEADNENLMDGNVFKTGVTSLENSAYFNTIKVNNQFVPSVFIDKGNTYTLWTTDGESKEFDISCPPSNAAIAYLNEYGNEGYDVEFARKLQLHDDENKSIEGANILVYWEGNDTYPYFQLTDDLAVMNLLNDGKACWILDPGTSDGISIPAFGRYRFASGGWTIDDSLDFGQPKELNIPSVTIRQEATVYERWWRNYLTDRFSVNTKVMRCKVDLSGLSPGQDLLRRFWWYEGALWVLNKIENYSMTTYDLAECEFVQVQDTDNYTNGQTM